VSLRVLAIAAPQFQSGGVGDLGISSADPASLFNGCRWAAYLAQQKIGPWGESNWAGTRAARRPAVLLMNSLDDSLPVLHERLETIRPNLVLIGAMSVCLPGAVAVARYVRALLGDDVCIVLGGRHATEALNRPLGALQLDHHPSSPLMLMKNGRIEPLFDIVVSGDGEYIIAAIGERVAEAVLAKRPAAHASRDLAACADVPGRWVAGAVIDGKICSVAGRGPEIDYDQLPPPCEMFGVRTSFDVFGVPTAHVFSDVGRGCIYDCNFCSERRSVTGLPRLDGSPKRLYRQLAAAARVIHEDTPGVGASAFCEDSTILGFSPALVRELEQLWQAAPLPIRWGGQLTIDQILSRPPVLSSLRATGCEYLFLGLETLEPGAIGGLSKDVGSHRGAWVQRAERVCSLLKENGMTAGVAVLFGLGESHQARLALLDKLGDWRSGYGFPDPISLNWAVQHPLLGADGGAGYEYLDWALPRGPLQDLLRNFGEASIRYSIPGTTPPRPAEVTELVRAATLLRNTLPLRRRDAQPNTCVHDN